MARITDPVCKGEQADMEAAENASLSRLAAMDFPEGWCSGENGARLLSIMAAANSNGEGCSFHKLGACLFRVRARRDMSCGPEACSAPPGGFRQCFVLGSRA